MPTLHWLNKDKTIKEAKKVPYRILKENKDLSYGNDINTENMIIKGDNLEVLKSLLPYYTGKVKCIYIDPPYNTGNIFEHYNDNLEHSIWLNMMYPRLELMKQLLAEDGVMCCQIDNEELAYLKVILDEIFGRDKFVTILNIEMSITQGMKVGSAKKGNIVKNGEYIILYTKNGKKDIAKTILYDKAENFDTHYSIYLEQNNDIYIKKDLVDVLMENEDIYNEFKKYDLLIKNKININTISKAIDLSEKIKKYIFFEISDKIYREMMASINIDNNILSTINNQIINYNNYLIARNNNGTIVQYRNFKETLNYNDEYFSTYSRVRIRGDFWKGYYSDMMNVAKEGSVEFKNSKKPERLIKDILRSFTQPNDLILDCFLGSGTTAAVAHKMNRKYIGVELGDHAITHVVPRLKKVIDGSDQGGISKGVDWKGGGGYKFYELGETIFDEKGKIRLNIDFNTLANHIWFSETGTASSNNNFVNNIGIDGKTALLGIYKNTAYILLYNGILRDKRPIEGNVLTNRVLRYLKELLNGSSYTNMIIYGDACKVRREVLEQNKIIFKQIPYDVKGK